ncbi:MAG: patatin family protein, partial [Dethiobacteria bacterium]
YKIEHIFDVLSRSIDIMSREIHQAQSQDADLLITPGVDDIGPFDFHRAEEAISRGEAAARHLLPLITKSMKEG